MLRHKPRYPSQWQVGNALATDIGTDVFELPLTSAPMPHTYLPGQLSTSVNDRDIDVTVLGTNIIGMGSVSMANAFASVSET
jgi:hypothetical protein